MKKEALKEKAIQLRTDGLSLGKIAIQLGVPKPTIYRWTKHIEDTNETDDLEFETNETKSDPISESFEPIQSINETVETHSIGGFGSNDTVIERKIPIKSSYEPAHGVVSKEMAQIEMKKMELEHDYRMAELDFRKSKYENEQENLNQQRKLEMLQKELHKKDYELNELKRSENEKSTIDSIDKTIPNEIRLKFKPLIKKYLSFEKKSCTEQIIYGLFQNSQRLRLDIYSWASKSKIGFDDIVGLKYVEDLISDLKESWSSFEEGSNDEKYLVFNPDFKYRIKEWVNS